MPPAIKDMIDSVDRTELQRVIDELRQTLQACEDLLAAVGRFQTGTDGEIVVSGSERAPAPRKRELVLAILGDRPGYEWTTREVRDALAARGVDPQAGTPVKNILWNLAKEGHVHAAGNGVYKLSVLRSSADPRYQEAVAV